MRRPLPLLPAAPRKKFNFGPNQLFDPKIIATSWIKPQTVEQKTGPKCDPSTAMRKFIEQTNKQELEQHLHTQE
jgi:hypothetical protein